MNYKAVSILLVDDDDVDVMGIKRAFKKLKIANPLIRAKDGIDALELLDSGVVKSPYLILLDLNMPRLGGIELLRALREDDRWSSSIIFVLTTSQDDEDKAAAYENHIAGYIVKENLDQGFDQLVNLLDHYWRLVEIPA